MRKLVIILSMLFITDWLNAQEKKEFELWISSLNKAANNRMTYHITEDSIVIKTGPYDFIYFAKNYEKDKVVYQTSLDSNQRKMINKMGIAAKNDSLKSQYTNLCIIDGMILHFHFEWSNKTKSTTLSNYYLPMMTSFTEFVNKIVIDKYKIWYDKKWLTDVMKECPSERILD